MRLLAFLLAALTTIALVMVLNVQLKVGGAKTPPLGSFLSPHHGLWQNAEPSDIDFNQELQIAGLIDKVEVYIDDRLVPHVFASNDRDAAFVQGYLHAKFRLWQMEFQVFAAGGRLSEIMGDVSGGTNFLDIDRSFRRLGMVYAAEQSLKALEADLFTKNIADAYTAGINAYILSLQSHQYPIEYKLLNYKPEPWTNLKSALFMKYMAFDLAGNEWDFEMTNARKVFSPELLELLYPVTRDSLDPIVPKGTIYKNAGLVIKKPLQADSINNTFQPFGLRDSLRPDKDNGSNNWAVAGSKTSSGKPILCNDPHLGLNLPAIWFEMQIATPEYNSYGVSFPGGPSIIIGFNDSCTWGVTNAGRDVRDYYEIKFRDSSMQEYLYNGKWKKTAFRKEIIKVKDKPDVVESIAMTVFGPVMFDHRFPASGRSGDTTPARYYAVRWKAHDASNDLRTFAMLNRAKNMNDFSDAIRTFEVPGQNFIFASKTGEIGLVQQGKFPAKWRRQGDFIMPGQDSTYAWQGNIPADENPSSFNPARGFVSSANQLPADATYPYYLGGSFDLYRGLTLNRELTRMEAITPTDMMALQNNNYNAFAETARPLLLQYINRQQLDVAELEYLDEFARWNLQNDANEAGPSIFNVWFDSLAVAVWKDEFETTKLKLRWPAHATLIEALLRDTAFIFIDDITTNEKESLGDIVTKSFKMALPAIKKAAAEGKLAWGKFKDTGIRHLLRLPSFSRLHLPIGGGEHILNAAKQYHGPSWRMVVHLDDATEAYGVYPGGQSGNPGSKYYDSFVQHWAAGKYYPLLFLQQQQANSHQRIRWKMTFTKA